MNKPWKLMLVLLGIFIAGGVTGAFLTKRFGREWVSPKRPAPEQWAPNHMKRLAERLGLSREQEEQLRPIVQRNMEELGRLRNESMAVSKGVFERMEREISEKLTPEQRVKFEQLNKEMRDRARKDSHKDARPPGPGGPPPGESGRPPGEVPPPEKPPGGG